MNEPADVNVKETLEIVKARLVVGLPLFLEDWKAGSF